MTFLLDLNKLMLTLKRTKTLVFTYAQELETNTIKFVVKIHFTNLNYWVKNVFMNFWKAQTKLPVQLIKSFKDLHV